MAKPKHDLTSLHEVGIATLRRALPVQQYLHLLHLGALTGYLPRMDAHTGQIREQTPMNADGSIRTLPEGEDPAGALDAKTRVDLLKYLTNKVMPDPKSEQLLAPPSPMDRHLTLDEVRSMSNEELLAVAHQAAKDEEAR